MSVLRSKKAVVLLASYNGAKYIAELLQSLADQRDVEFDLYVRDDGSIDDTVSVLGAFRDKLNITLVPSAVRLGPAMGFLSLLAEVSERYSYYFFCDQDDVWLPDKMKNSIAALTELGAVPAMHCTGQKLIGSNGQHIGNFDPNFIPDKRSCLYQNIATGCTVAFNALAAEMVASRTPRALVMHDWWVYIVIVHFGVVKFDSIGAILYRQHGSNQVGTAPSLFLRASGRVKRACRNGSKRSLAAILDQAGEFGRLYGELLDLHDKERYSIFGGSRSKSALFEIVWRDLRRQSFLDTVIARVYYSWGLFR